MTFEEGSFIFGVVFVDVLLQMENIEVKVEGPMSVFETRAKVSRGTCLPDAIFTWFQKLSSVLFISCNDNIMLIHFWNFIPPLNCRIKILYWHCFSSVKAKIALEEGTLVEDEIVFFTFSSCPFKICSKFLLWLLLSFQLFLIQPFLRKLACLCLVVSKADSPILWL